MSWYPGKFIERVGGRTRTQLEPSELAEIIRKNPLDADRYYSNYYDRLYRDVVEIADGIGAIIHELDESLNTWAALVVIDREGDLGEAGNLYGIREELKKLVEVVRTASLSIKELGRMMDEGVVTEFEELSEKGNRLLMQAGRLDTKYRRIQQELGGG
jgi:hypothetical protein